MATPLNRAAHKVTISQIDVKTLTAAVFSNINVKIETDMGEPKTRIGRRLGG
jgi:hypothetical protein